MVCNFSFKCHTDAIESASFICLFPRAYADHSVLAVMNYTEMEAKVRTITKLFAQRPMIPACVNATLNCVLASKFNNLHFPIRSEKLQTMSPGVHQQR